jgi:hypothetical protein
MVLAMMGGAELDFREARLSSGVTEIEIFALMGGVEILVPPGVRIDAGGMAIMGSFAHGAGNNESTAPDAPVIRIGGIAIMGGVEVHVRLPGETAREARRRLKEQQKQLKSRPRELP